MYSLIVRVVVIYRLCTCGCAEGHHPITSAPRASHAATACIYICIYCVVIHSITYHLNRYLSLRNNVNKT